jgi:subtilisin family serine protease
MFVRRLSLGTTALLAALAACSDAPTPTAPSDAAPAEQRAAVDPVIANRWIVVFNPDVSDAPGLARRLAAEHRGTLHHTYQHAIKGFAATLPPAAVEALRRNPNVKYVEADGITRPTYATQTGSTWGLDRVDQRDLPAGGSYDGNYRQLRNGLGVTVYVIDSGIDTAHAEFGGRARVGHDALGGNGLDCNWHGTHVAGTIGGNSWGVAKAVQLVAVRILPCSGNTPTSTTIAGVDWVRYNAVKPAVANLSVSNDSSTALDDAVRSLISSGVTTVAAAGNQYPAVDDACNYSPARVTSALTVGATTNGDQKTSISKFGGCLDLFAPGENISSASLGGGSLLASGTSMAAPHVAGAAALYLQGNPGATPATVHAFIVDNATTGRLTNIGTGSPNRLLYTLATTDSYKRIRNAWQTSWYINLEYGLAANAAQTGWWSAHWVWEPVPGTSTYRIRNRYTNAYLHNESGSLQAGNIQAGWLSAQWYLDSVDGTRFRVRNAWTNGYLHVEYGSLQLGAIQSGWLSAQWTLETTT